MMKVQKGDKIRIRNGQAGMTTFTSMPEEQR